MRNRRLGRKLGKDSKHRKAMFRNMATALFDHGHIRTTDMKAKELRRYAEKLITIAKKDTLHARRQAAAVIRDKTVLKKLFDEIGPHFKDRPGGYTRIVKLGIRKGDSAPISYIELVPEEYKPKKAKKRTSKKRLTAAAASKPAKKASSKKKAAEDLGLAEGTQAAPEIPEVAEVPEPKAALADSETPSEDEQAPQAVTPASKPAKSKRKTSEMPEPQAPEPQIEAPQSEIPQAEAPSESEGSPDSPEGEEAESGEESSEESSTEEKE